MPLEHQRLEQDTALQLMCVIALSTSFPMRTPLLTLLLAPALGIFM